MTTDRLEITVDDAFLLQEFEALEEGVGEPADEGDTEALEVVLLDQLVQVHPVNKRNNCRQTVNKNLTATTFRLTYPYHEALFNNCCLELLSISTKKHLS